jgi:ABC-type transport system, involved in lipoprotein release, permease component
MRPGRAIGLAVAQATRTGSKSLLLGCLAAATAAALALAFALGAAVSDNTRRFLTGRYMGEVVVAQGRSAALFGYAVSTGNERQQPIEEYDRIEALALAAPGVASADPLLVGELSLFADGENEERCIGFGIDSKRKDGWAPGFELESGSFLPGPGGALVSDALAARLEKISPGSGRVGGIVTGAALGEAGLGLKPLRISGIYRYDGGVAELDRIVYLEASTARRLFAVEADDVAQRASAAWHYLRLRLKPGADPAVAIASLNASFAAAGLGATAMGWEAASSGYATTASILRAACLGGIGLSALFALLVLSNALRLLAESRRRAIGTVRALGATKSFVFSWISAEGLFASAAGAIAGSALAAGALAAVSRAGPVISSPAFREIFASDRLVIRARPVDLAAAALLSIAAGAPAILGAARRCVRVSPYEAMRR